MRKNAGFTLLELLISVSLTAAIVILASHLYETVNKVGNRTLSINRNWGVQQFLRQQFEAADSSLNGYFLAIHGTSDRFSYISKNSAQYGQNQRPVLVTYRFNYADRRLMYYEISVPPWWDENQERYRALIDSWRYQSGDKSYEAPLFSNVESFELRYWEAGRRRWSEVWNNKKNMPPLVRLRVTVAGKKQELILAPGALSLSSAFGY